MWSGECEDPFATLFRHKSNYLDLTAAAKIRWGVKTSGFHVVRPVVKLADGNMFVGDYASASVPMLLVSEFVPAAIRWAKLDPKRVVTMGGTGGAFNEIWVTPDLSRVDEVGFVDLMPGSGHGTGGYIHVSQFQVYGRPVPANCSRLQRAAADSTCHRDAKNKEVERRLKPARYVNTDAISVFGSSQNRSQVDLKR